MRWIRGSRRWLGAATVGMAVWMAASPAQALVPPTITHQGRLFDVQGVPVVGTVDLLFALYDAPDALAPIWMEMHSIDFDDGYFSVQLGVLDPV